MTNIEQSGYKYVETPKAHDVELFAQPGRIFEPEDIEQLTTQYNELIQAHETLQDFTLSHDLELGRFVVRLHVFGRDSDVQPWISEWLKPLRDENGTSVGLMTQTKNDFKSNLPISE